ncbi:MAG: LptA/OstA family protein [Paracoccus sp. (in: a-proteobacteria)]|uniref:LptA/OstA family protein n=1 Tax=Paracoccus sp. TaxID=267 RepID=UPI0026DF8DE7|nr:LptA/OstA family protein [Paracoccus sp. (in: a-proteobacteria)]MDO5612724.1 LptA/OstA family protein [Paracoccus sp. (in: a-proteobacteria)]
MFRATLIALTLTALPAAAQTVAFGGMRADISAPVEVSADSLSVNQADGTALFQGNVVIGQGEMRLSAQSVRVEYADGAGAGTDGQRRIRALDASGGVVLVSGPDAAEAKSARYEVDSGMVTLSGDVLLTQGSNVMSGDRIVVNLADGTAQAQGRVRSVLQPGRN